jgi:hypothetical protein
VCSGVLVGCDSALTTAHCFNANVGLKTHLYIPHAGFIPIESATRHPAYVDALINKPPGWIDTTREDDIAFVKLAEPVAGVTPATIVGLGAPPPGTPGFVVGFGRDPVTESSLQNPGIKRSGGMELDTCKGDTLGGLDVLCWTPTAPLPLPGDEVSTCTGDSGGPLFTGAGIGRVVSGITKGAVYDPQGQPDPCLPPVSPYDVSVSRHREWLVGSDGTGGIVAATGAVPLDAKQCTSLGQLPETFSAPVSCDPGAWGPGESARACGFAGVLGGGNPVEGRYSFGVPANTQVLRVALNGIATSLGGIDSDLYLRFGVPAESHAHDCAADTAGTLGFCEIEAPAAGVWHVLVDQEQGEGEHQVVVALLGDANVPSAVPGMGAAGATVSVLILCGWMRQRLRSGSR